MRVGGLVNVVSWTDPEAEGKIGLGLRLAGKIGPELPLAARSVQNFLLFKITSL